VDARRTGISLIVVGTAALVVGMVLDAVRQADDPTLAQREGIFAFDAFPQWLFFGGIIVLALGLLVLVLGHRLYASTPRVAVQRRLAQIGAPVGAVILIVGGLVAASNTALGERAQASAVEADAVESDATSTAEHPAGHDTATTGPTEAAAIAPTPYDPTKPIDLGGVEGVSPEQQARAENLIAISLSRLPKYSDPAVAEADGFRSIGDAATGDEHYVNTAYFNDGRMLDPDYPESLVYQPDGAGGKKLAAAMYMAEPGITLDSVPDVGGKLTQWHIHNNLCFTGQGRVGGLTSADGSCQPPLVKGPETPMIHVWIQPHPCGPFAALEGVGAGQIAEGETRLCDAAHGGH